MKNLRVTVTADEATFTGLVIGNDPDLGITIVNAENKEQFLMCVRSPLAAQATVPASAKEKLAAWVDQYPLLYNFINEQISTELVDITKTDQFMLSTCNHKCGRNPEPRDCAFG